MSQIMRALLGEATASELHQERVQRALLEDEAAKAAREEYQLANKLRQKMTKQKNNKLLYISIGSFVIILAIFTLTQLSFDSDVNGAPMHFVGDELEESAPSSITATPTETATPAPTENPYAEATAYAAQSKALANQPTPTAGPTQQSMFMTTAVPASTVEP